MTSISESKLAGILVESITPSLPADRGIAIIGGLNINSMPKDFLHIWMPRPSLRMHAKHDSPYNVNPLLLRSSCLHHTISRVVDDFPAILDELKHSVTFLGKK